MSNFKTFDIQMFDGEKLLRSATFNQCRGLAARWSKDKAGNMDWLGQKRLQATLYANAQAGKLSFEQAHKLFEKSKAPVKYVNQIKEYLKAKESK